MKVFIVTDPELGWNCIVGVYTTLEAAIKCLVCRSGKDRNTWEKYINNYDNLDGGVIHENTLEDEFTDY